MSVKQDATLKISAEDWDVLLWNGTLEASFHDQPNLVKDLLSAAQTALAEQNNISYKKTLGVAKVLSGNKRRWKSAIQDFEVYVASSNLSEERKDQLKRWIESLSNGQNPFTKKEIQILLAQ